LQRTGRARSREDPFEVQIRGDLVESSPESGEVPGLVQRDQPEMALREQPVVLERADRTEHLEPGPSPHRLADHAFV